MHEFLSAHQRLVDLLTFASAAVAVVSMSQLALSLTILSTLIAIVLGGFRLHDRIRYGPRRGGE